MRKIKVGIIQQANVADMRINLMNLAKSIESCAAHGAQLVLSLIHISEPTRLTHLSRMPSSA